MKFRREELEWNRVGGLDPDIRVCVGDGFSREEIKELILGRGYGLVQEAVVDLSQLALEIVRSRLPQVTVERVLSPSARQEILRVLVANRSILARLPEFKRLRRQKLFWAKLDRSVQTLRLIAAHAEEWQVMNEHLLERVGANPLRNETAFMGVAYEAWLEASDFWDLPRLLKKAIEILENDGWSGAPQKVLYFAQKSDEGLERSFWETLERGTEVVRIHASERVESEVPWPRAQWQIWHTWDDAAERLADGLQAQFEEQGSWNDTVVLIGDSGDIRRSMKRAFESRGIPLADPRDPTRLKWDEALKWALLPLEMVARDFEREKVIAVLRGYFPTQEFERRVAEIHARGIRQGLGLYTGELLMPVGEILQGFARILGGRKTCSELAQAHLQFLKNHIPESEPGLLSFFERMWTTFGEDLERVGWAAKKAPLLFWWERFGSRLAETAAPVERKKAAAGVQVFRMQQCSLRIARRVWVFGLPASWLDNESGGDYGLSFKEREVLAKDFGIRGSDLVRIERKEAFSAWLAHASEVVFLDAAYSTDGREREKMSALLKELGFSGEAEEWGAHPRWQKSYSSLRPISELQALLPPLPIAELTATALDSYSRCGFQALAYHRWKLRDLQEPDADLWPEARGNILHDAVKRLVISRNDEGVFELSVANALSQAWHSQRPKGLMVSRRTESWVKSKLEKILQIFIMKEREYFAQSPSVPVALDQQKLHLILDGVTIVGTPDRIDLHADGLFVLDYKTSSQLPHGSEMLEGYRLQLPFYALAAQKHFEKPVLGLQFVELSSKGTRSSGMFFKRWNGKEDGKITKIRGQSKSLLDLEPEEAWSRVEEQMVVQAHSYVKGTFAAHPKRGDRECSTCRVADFCGYRRLSSQRGTETEGDA